MKILIDDRETRESQKMQTYMKALAEEHKFEVAEAHLLVGDYSAENKSICIERKSIADFYGSIVSQHIFDQAKNMAENFEERYLLISGNYKQLLSDPNIYHVSVHVLLGAMASLASKYRITTITCETDKQIAYLVYKLCEKSGESPDLNMVKRLSFNTEDQKISALTAIRGISITKATDIMAKFKTIKAVCDATPEQLSEIPGFGKKTSENIKEVFY